MAKKRDKKRHSKQMHLFHAFFIIILCVLLFLLFSMKSAQDDDGSSFVVFVDFELVDLEETVNETSVKRMSENHDVSDINSHKLSILMKNNFTEVIDCYVIFMIQNETYKNETIVDVPVLEAGEEFDLVISFEMPTGNSDYNLSKFC